MRGDKSPIFRPPSPIPPWGGQGGGGGARGGWGCEGDLDLAMNERYQGFQAIVDTNGPPAGCIVR
ncbi:MAG: hypothetical protein EAZ78_23505 [Oscillatoriales cyanobacterium]|nr:MAG: hypothetical protein EAZ78_23505 [Oscillatoriales cyanobacterium]